MEETKEPQATTTTTVELLPGHRTWWTIATPIATFSLLCNDATPRAPSVAVVEYKTFDTMHTVEYFATFEAMIQILEEHKQQCVLLLRFDQQTPGGGFKKTRASWKLQTRQIKWNKAMADRLTATVRRTSLVFANGFVRFLVNLVLKVVPPRNPTKTVKSVAEGIAWLHSIME